MIELKATGEEFEVWKPLPNLSGEFEFLELRENEDGLLITLENESGRTLGVQLHEPLGYRVNSRGLNNAWSEFDAAVASFGCCWKALRSKWIENLEPAPDTSPVEIGHYLLFAGESVIELLAAEPPHVSWFDNFFGDAT